MRSDLFVIEPRIHTFFRFTAAFIIAPILIWKGYTLKDNIILLIGVITLLVDAYTFYMSINSQN